ncbi:PAS domain-containing sensor histidine kinase [Haloarchaeobius iranensis]|uniref:histidine kinase n=1 Tax=Haloarchaeobius iranensis TaxID=996166 RepID=A0A1G9Z3L8_9EURY|nr:PAS domain S-box protein [Haloarchaeobius iranensis]SDN15525.1 PAS domain S-box-containing protein [Haloarchaeobius iranensis]
MSPATDSEQPPRLALYGDASDLIGGRLAAVDDATVRRVDSMDALLASADDGLDCVVCAGASAVAVLDGLRADHETPVVVVDETADVTRASRVSEYRSTLYVPVSRVEDTDFDLEAAVRELVADWWTESDSRRRLAALESAREGIGILDADGKYAYANRAYAAKYGYESSELVGEHWRVLYPSEEVARFEEEILPTLEREGTWAGTAIGRRADGEEFPEELSLALLDDGGHVCVLRDITDRQQREERLQVLDRVLRHNLRNKMCVVQGHIDDALRVTTEDAVREPLETAKQEGEDLLRLARKARTFHRLLDRATLDHAPVDLGAFVVDAVDSLSVPGRDVVVTTTDDDVAVEADPALLKAVLGEVVTVLVEGSPDGGTVSVSVTTGVSGGATVRLSTPDSSLPSYEFDVVDRGEETPLYHGEGIGLWFVRWATVLMGGHVDYDSDAEALLLSFPRAGTTDDGTDPDDA